MKLTTRPRVGRLGSLLALVSMFLLAFSGLVLADDHEKSATVTTTTVMPDRNLDLLDLVGDDLVNVALRNKRATPFQVRVTDETIDLLDQQKAPFWVQATMNNLYRVQDPDAPNLGIDPQGDRIESQHIDLGYALNPLGARDVLADVNPRYLVGAATGITCDDVAAALDTTVTALLAASDPICSLLTDITGLLIPGEDLVVADVEVATVLTLAEELVDAVWDAVEGLPLTLTNPDSGAFTSANCSTGLGAGDLRCAGSNATAHTVLRGQPLSLEALLDIVSDIVGTVGDLVGTPEAAALVDEVIAALNAAGGDAADLADALASYAPADQVTLINSLLDEVGLVDPLELGDLLLSGQYRSIPTLTVDTATAPLGGQYAGTLTATLFEGSL